MKLPCWIKHDWGKYEEPYNRVYNAVYRYNNGLFSDTWKERRYFQDRRCNKCGVIDTTCIKIIKIEG